MAQFYYNKHRRHHCHVIDSKCHKGRDADVSAPQVQMSPLAMTLFVFCIVFPGATTIAPVSEDGWPTLMLIVFIVIKAALSAFRR